MKVPALILSSILGLSAAGQIAIDRITLGVDYNQFTTGLLTPTEVDDKIYSAVGELAINEVWAAECYYSFDNTYHAFTPIIPVENNYNNYMYVGLRAYPIDNYHSRALSLRHKRNYGWYFAFGYAAVQSTTDMFVMSQVTNPVLDENGNPVENDDGTIQQYTSVDRMDRGSITVTQWGQQFGFGFKQFHSKYLCTDVGVYSDAYVRSNRSATSWYEKSFRADGAIEDPIVDPAVWSSYVEAVEFWARNGRGFQVRMLMSINLDVRK